MNYKNKITEGIISFAIASCFLTLPSKVLAGNAYFTLTLYNCIQGKTLYPRVYCSNMEGCPSGQFILHGPSQSGTCGQGVMLLNNATDGGGIGVASITGLNGGTIVYSSNKYHHDYLRYPDTDTNLPYRGWTWGITGGASLAFVSNKNYKKLPSGVTCPSGSDEHGPVCISLKQECAKWLGIPHHAICSKHRFTYKVYVFASPYGQHAGLPNLPSSVGE